MNLIQKIFAKKAKELEERVDSVTANFENLKKEVTELDMAHQADLLKKEIEEIIKRKCSLVEYTVSGRYVRDLDLYNDDHPHNKEIKKNHEELMAHLEELCRLAKKEYKCDCTHTVKCYRDQMANNKYYGHSFETMSLSKSLLVFKL